MNAPTVAEPVTTDEQSLKEWVDRLSGHVADLRYDAAAPRRHAQMWHSPPASVEP